MKIAVFGASGQIGRYLLPRLRAQGHSVVALSRTPREAGEGIEWLRGRLPDAVPALPGVQAIVSLGPLDHFADWLARADLDGRPRVVAMSSMSADSKQDSPDPAERALAARLRESEQALAGRCAAAGCAWTVLRATLIYGAGADRSLTPLARRALRWRLFPLPGGRGLRQPVHADDLAQAVQAASCGGAGAGQVLAIGGGERLPAARMFARVRRSLPAWTLPVPMPTLLLRLAVRGLGRGRGMVDRLDRDLVADNTAMTAALGVHPRRFRPGPATWTVGDPS